MSRQTMILGMMQAATRGHDPVKVVHKELSGCVRDPYRAHLSAWIAAASQTVRPLPRGDLLWSGLAPIDCRWLHSFPLFAVPYGTEDRNVLRPFAVFIGDSPRRTRHQSLIHYALLEWVRRWSEDQPLHLVTLFKRDIQDARATAHIYAPSDAEIVADYWGSKDIDNWHQIETNPDKPAPPATYRSSLPAYLRN